MEETQIPKLNVNKKSNIDIKQRLGKFGVEILVDDEVELIIQFAGTPVEIAKLLSGKEITKTAKQNAMELLNQ